MATIEQVQAALRRETAAREAYQTLKNGHVWNRGRGDRGWDPPESDLDDTPEAREYDAASRELAGLQAEAEGR